MAGVVVTHGGELLGLVQLLGRDREDRRADFAAASFVEDHHKAAFTEGALLFLIECFDRFDIRKIYVTLSEPTLQTVRSIFDYAFSVEGVFKEYVWLDGDYHDVYVASTSLPQVSKALAGRPWLASVTTASQPPKLTMAQLDELLTEITGRWGIESLSGDEVLFGPGTEIDSLEALELLVAVEGVIGRDIPYEMFASLSTMNDLRAFVASAIEG